MNEPLEDALPVGWKELSDAENAELWQRLYDFLKFEPSSYPQDFPGFTAPEPSLVMGCRRQVPEDHVGAHSHLEELIWSTAAREGTDIATTLDWQHQGYLVTLAGFDTSLYWEDWPVPILPQGDYYVWAPKDLSWGSFGHPWAEVICLWGAPLLACVEELGLPNEYVVVRRVD